MRRLVFVLVAACIHPRPTPMTWPALDAKLLADSAATFNFKLGLPTPLAITPDGAVLFRRTPPRSFESDLYELDANTGAVKTLITAGDLLGAGPGGGVADEHLSNAEKARRERSRTATRGIVDIDVSADGKLVLVPLAARLYLVDRQSGARTEIDPKGDAYDPHLAPDGKSIAFVRDGDVWVIAADKKAEPRRLTKHPDGFEYGIAEFAAQEELDRRRGFWWSPDSKQLLFQRTDQRPVDTIYVADPRHNDKPPVPFKYPRAGHANAIVDLGLIAASASPAAEPRDVQWLTWDVAKYPYLARISWPGGKAPLTIVVLSREQQDLAVIAPLAKQTLVEEHDDAWVNLASSGRSAAIGATPGAPLWLADGSGFLWLTESHDDAWTLELRAPDGKPVRTITRPELGVSALIGLGATGSGNVAAIVEASPDPRRSDIWSVPLDGGEPSRLSTGDGLANAWVDHGVVVITSVGSAGGRKTVANGHELPSVAEVPALVPTTQLEQVTLGGRTHYVAITRPRAFDPQRRYPVLLKVYGGPHAVTVEDARDLYVMDQWYADAGFIVVRIDGRGTPNRGRAWERAILRDLLTIPLDDQIAGLRAVAARHPELDLDRVGVFGWSFGGYLSALALLLRPDVFRAAVAGAPVTDWTLYDTAYTERYMKTPAGNPDGYRATSALTHAARLERPLLVLHGITDDNVHFAHTLALVEALYVAGKRAEVITLSATHMVPDPALNLAREQVQIDFFRQHLGPP
jgi:dipeptidyl-peptidase-4